MTRPRKLAALDSPPLWFTGTGYPCESGPKGVYRGDPDGFLMGHRDRVPADEPTYGLQVVEDVETLSRIIAAMRAAGYWPRP